MEKVPFQSKPGLYVIGKLYRPRVAAGNLPTILYVNHRFPNGTAQFSSMSCAHWTFQNCLAFWLPETWFS